MYYQITKTVRLMLARPKGELFTGMPDVSFPKVIAWLTSIYPTLLKERITENSPKIVCVGDIVSKAMLEHPVLSDFVKMCLVDGETQRDTKITFTLPKGMQEARVFNPRGMINSDIFAFLKKNYASKLRLLVYVEGEEDLLVLPAVLEGESGYYIFYGQPPITDAQPPISAGCVGVQVNEKIQSEYKEILNLFEKKDSANTP